MPATPPGSPGPYQEEKTDGRDSDHTERHLYSIGRWIDGLRKLLGKSSHLDHPANGRLAKRYRASYLVFENPLTDEDRRLLAELAEGL